MGRYSTVISTLIAVVALTGCQQTISQLYEEGLPIESHPIKAGASQSSFENDRLNCEVYAANAVPQKLRSYTTPTYTTTSYTSCTGYGWSTSCRTTGGDVIGGDLIISDANDGLRQRVYAQCIAQNGWQFANIQACPKGTTLDMLTNTRTYPRDMTGYCYIPAGEDVFYSGTLK